MHKDNYIYAYYQGIKNGTYTVGRWIELVYDYIIKGLEEKRFFFDQKKAADAIDWMESHTFHTEGPLAPGPLRFEPWQKAFFSAVYGLVDEKGLRQFREIVLVVGRQRTWEDIAEQMHMAVSWVRGGLHSQALKEVGRILQTKY